MNALLDLYPKPIRKQSYAREKIKMVIYIDIIVDKFNAILIYCSLLFLRRPLRGNLAPGCKGNPASLASSGTVQCSSTRKPGSCLRCRVEARSPLKTGRRGVIWNPGQSIIAKPHVLHRVGSYLCLSPVARANAAGEWFSRAISAGSFVGSLIGATTG